MSLIEKNKKVINIQVQQLKLHGADLDQIKMAHVQLVISDAVRQVRERIVKAELFVFPMMFLVL